MSKLLIPRRIYIAVLIYCVVVISGTFYAVAKEYKTSDGIVFSNGNPLVGDFICFYAAGRLAREDFRSLYNAKRHEEIMNDALKPHRVPGLLMFFYPPLVALIFLPFALLPLIHAFAAWTLASLFLFSLSVTLILKQFDVDKKTAFLLYLVALTYVPFVSDCMIAGQTSAISFCVFTLIYLFLKSRRENLAGLFLGVGFYYKPTLFVIFAVLMLLRKRWRLIFSALLSFLVVTSFSIVLLGLKESLHFLQILISNPMHGKLGGGMASDMLLHKGANLRAVIELNLGSHYFLANSIYALTLAGVLVLYEYRDGRRSIEKWHQGECSDITAAIDIGLNVLLAPYLLVYDLTILLLPMLVVTVRCLSAMRRGKQEAVVLAATICLYICSIFPAIVIGAVVVVAYPFILSIWLISMKKLGD